MTIATACIPTGSNTAACTARSDSPLPASRSGQQFGAVAVHHQHLAVALLTGLGALGVILRALLVVLRDWRNHRRADEQLIAFRGWVLEETSARVSPVTPEVMLALVNWQPGGH
jgi:hypothetical protein